MVLAITIGKLQIKKIMRNLKQTMLDIIFALIVGVGAIVYIYILITI